MGNINVFNGYSLMECLVATSLVLITSAMATPSLSNWFEKRDIKSALVNTSIFVKQARYDAISQGMDVTIILDPTNHGCIGATTNQTCNCFTANACQIDTSPRTLLFDQYNSAVKNATSHRLQFDKLHGFTGGRGYTITLHSQHYSGKVIISSLGRVRFCTLQHMHGVAQC